MISEKYKCVFTHIPKTAGQSVEHFFLNLHGLSWGERAPLLLKHNPDPLKGPERLAHLKSSEYVSCGYLDEDIFNNYFKFTFVRNPWARLVSEFSYRNDQKKTSFKEFVTKGLPIESGYTDAYRHIMPQYEYLYEGSGRCLVDFIGRFESLQEDFDVICSKLHIVNSQLPHVNSSAREATLKKSINKLMGLKSSSRKKHYTEYYDDETKEIVERIYSKDIEQFNYSFDSEMF